MAKRLKHQLSRVIPSLQLCRPGKHDSTFPGNTVPAAAYRLSPVNPKSFDITYPSSNNNSFVAPAPPSTPEKSVTTPSSRRSSSRLKPKTHVHDRDIDSSPGYQWKKEKRLNAVTRARERTTESREKIWEETEMLLSAETSRSFSDELLSSSSSEFFSDMWAASKEVRQWKAVETPPESVAVVKRSENPLEDFKKSMWEMVLEKKLFKPEDLEQLLLCLLNLNSRRYHGVIVEAFSEIWHVLFSGKQSESSDILKLIYQT